MCKTFLVALAALSIAATTASQDPQKSGAFVPRPTPVKTAPPWIDPGQPLPAKPPGTIPAPTAALTSAKPASPAGFDPTRIMFDDRGVGGLWAATGAYKVRFEPKGVTYVPFLGSAAARNWPVTFRLARVSVAGQELALPLTDAVHRDRDGVALRRGDVVERWLMRAAEVEQTFQIIDLPQRGEVLVEVAVDTDLEGQRLARGFEFRSPDGGVRYGAAIAIDAAGRRVALESELVGDHIVHRVPAAFVAQAVLPIVVDPVVSTFSGFQGSEDFGSPDVAFDAGTGLFAVVTERRWSVTDTDVWSELRDQQGLVVPSSGNWVDVSTDDWRKPKVGANRAASRFLVVAEGKNVGTSTTDIRGRVREATGTFATLAPITISTATNDAIDPDVGGDGNQYAPDYWAVVWEHRYSSSDSDIYYRMVRDDGTFTTPAAIVLENSSTHEQRPRISKSNGRENSATQSWMVVFTREISPTVHATFAATLSWNGTITRPTFHAGPAVGGTNFIEPDVSSPTEVIGGRRYHLVVSQYVANPNDHDVWASLIADGQVLLGSNLTASSLVYDVTPSVDCDGYRFAVAYAHSTNLPTNDYDIRVMTVHARYASPAFLGFTESTIGLGTAPHWEGAPAVAARHLQGDGRYMVAYEDSNGGQPSIMRGAIYEGLGAGGLTLLPHGCHNFPISTIGDPMIGRRISFQVPGPTTGLSTSGTLFGLERTSAIQLPMCAVPCYLGVDGPAYGPLIHIDIPIDGSLVGARAAVQGWDLVGGSCIGAGLRLSDTYVMTVR